MNNLQKELREIAFCFNYILFSITAISILFYAMFQKLGFIGGFFSNLAFLFLAVWISCDIIEKS